MNSLKYSAGFSVGQSQLGNSDFQNYKELHVSVKYTTAFGEELCMVGSLPCTGSWNPEGKGLKMVWNESHNWTAKVPLYQIRGPINQLFFEFKFVILEHGKIKKWESGANHVFNGKKIYQHLQLPVIQKHITDRQN